MINATSAEPLAGQVAIITGAGRGIGQAISVRLAELGAHTVLCGGSRTGLDQTSDAIRKNRGGNPEKGSRKSSGKDADESSIIECDVVECDVTNLASVEALAK